MIYKKVLAVKVKEEKAYEEKQERLRKQYGIHKKNVVVVEKTNTMKFLIKVCVGMIKIAATLALLGLSMIGLVAIIYPTPRSELVSIFHSVVEQLIVLLGV